MPYLGPEQQKHTACADRQLQCIGQGESSGFPRRQRLPWARTTRKMTLQR